VIAALLLACAVAAAGQWLPETAIELDPEQPWLMDQHGGERMLLQVEPPGAELEAWSGGLRLTLKAGPGQTWLLPAEAISRQVVISVDQDTTVAWWRETSQGEPAAWDRYERALHAWAKSGGEVPPAPAAIPELAQEWRLRRQAMVAAGELDHDLLLRCAMQELEALRSRSTPDHGTRDLELGRLTTGETGSVQLKGPGVFTLRTRVLMEGQLYRRYALWTSRDGRPQGEHALFTTENEINDPGWGWPRSVSVTVPAGQHELSWRLAASDEMAVVDVQARMDHRRPSVQAFLLTLPHPRELDGYRAQGPVAELELAHLTGRADVVELARPLLDGAAQDLARARLVEHLEAPAEARQLAFSSAPTPAVALALARRWRDRRDIDPALLIDVAELLPADPGLLASIADALPQGFVRPRGRAIRTLASQESPGTDPSRWTQLAPEGSRGRIRVTGTGGGLPRVQVTPGQVATITLPEPAIEGRFPVLRMEASAPVHYRVDGSSRQGQGSLDEALSPGAHKIEVESGRIILMDAALVEGGDPVRDKVVGALPNRWLVPDPGAPGEVEVLAYGQGGRLVVSTDDGTVWELQTEPDPLGGPGISRAVLPVGPQARELRVAGPDDTLVGVALRRNSVEQHPAVPGPWPDPLEYFWNASREMIDQDDPSKLAELRLRRAASYHVLGLVVSAQREARAVAAMPGATPEQRAVGVALYRNTVPPVHTAEFPGPVTVDAALAWAQVVNPGAESCEDLVRIADQLLPPVSWPVHEAASSCYLQRGAVVDAWIQAEHAGPLGRVARLRAADGGDWRLVSRMDQDAGTWQRRVLRKPPEQADGLRSFLRELSLGVPWARTSYTVIRAERRTTIRFEGGGDLRLQLLCRDESFAVEPEPCTVPMVVDGEQLISAVPEAHLLNRDLTLEGGEHTVHIGPVSLPGQALAIRATLDGQLLPPQVEKTVHRLGHGGLRATVAGPTLLRLRVYEHGPVQLSVEGRSETVDDELLLPITSNGPVALQVDGPPESTVTISRLQVCKKPEPRDPPLPRSLDHNLPLPEADWATDLWMREVAAPAPTSAQPMGRGGTLGAWLEAGDDSTGVRDLTQHYRYAGGGAGWYERLDGTEHWVSVEAEGRASIDGPPGALLAGQWVHAIGAHKLRAQLAAAGSGGAGHVSTRGTWRYLQPLGPWWSIQPFAHLHLGYWTAAPEITVDPAAWNAYSAQHFFGLDLGAHLDWRPMRDARLRLYTELDGNPNMTPDGVHLGLRSDTLVWQNTWLKLGPELTWRFVDNYRRQAYMRPSVRSGLGTSWYQGSNQRWWVQARCDYYPLDASVEGLLGVGLQWSQGRGLRDRSPFDQVFTTALDLPLEDR